MPARRDLLIAAAVLLVGGALVLLLPEARIPVRGMDGAADRALSPLAVAPLVLAAVAETQRRRRPLVALAVGGVALVAGPLLVGWVALPVVVAGYDLLGCAVLHSSPRTSRAVVAAAGAVVVVATVVALVAGGPGAALRTALNLGLALGIPIAWTMEVRWHRERAELQRQRADQAERLATLESAAAVAAERARMARDLHDVVAGQLSGIAVQSAAALNLPDADPALLRRVLSSVRRDSVASLAQMRTMIGLLRDDSAGADRTVPGGLDLLDPVVVSAREAGLRVEVTDRRGGPPPPTATDRAALRIVQESLTNALKHAPGTAVRILLDDAGGPLVVEVTSGLVPGHGGGEGTGTGLTGLAERARFVGGTFAAGPRDGSWRVRAVLPAGGDAAPDPPCPADEAYRAAAADPEAVPGRRT